MSTMVLLSLQGLTFEDLVVSQGACILERRGALAVSEYALEDGTAISRLKRFHSR